MYLLSLLGVFQVDGYLRSQRSGVNDLYEKISICICVFVVNFGVQWYLLP